MRYNTKLVPCVYVELNDKKAWTSIKEMISVEKQICTYDFNTFTNQMVMFHKFLDKDGKVVEETLGMKYCVMCPIEKRYLPVDAFCRTCGGCSDADLEAISE